MYGTAAHVLADYFLEREKRRAVVFDDEAVEEGLKKELMVEDQIADQINLQQQIDKAIGQLPSTHAAVLLAHKGEGLSYEEVAEKLGLSIHTVEKYVTQSKFILRKVEWDR
jgi:RNA polymerase sigma-70 factor (ECF subfamily)